MKTTHAPGQSVGCVCGEKSALLAAVGVRKEFRVGGGLSRRRTLVAVDAVDLGIAAGETVALVGESGSGKTTLGRMLLAMTTPTKGEICFDSRPLAAHRGPALRAFRRRVQPIFQDPVGSLDPRWTVQRSVREPLDAYDVGSQSERDAQVAELLERVGLSVRLMNSYPHELSGGQCQRVAIAAALALDPDVIVADEPTSALDVLVQAQILNLLGRLQRERSLGLLLITHNLAVVEHLADRVAVMYLGRIVEQGDVGDVLQRPQHPYTQTLIAAVPRPRPGAAFHVPPRGDIASPLDPPAGCHFSPRCPLAIDICYRLPPTLVASGPGHFTACHVVAPAPQKAPARSHDGTQKEVAECLPPQ